MNKHRGIVVSGFDLTGNMIRPWADEDYLCYCIDIQHKEGEMRDGNIIYVGADMREWQPPFEPSSVVFQSYFPPCTDLATSGAHAFKKKGIDSLIEALVLFNAAIKLSKSVPAPSMIENPVSTISTYWRKPDYTFNPCDYAGYMGGEEDVYTKRTCLWTEGPFRMPREKPLPPSKGSWIYLMPPRPDRREIRAATPKGFARAVFEANAPHLK